MPTTLTYGRAETCLLETTEATRLGPQSAAQLSPDQIAQQIAACLEAPLAYPPLSQATIPGDEIVVAVEPGLPQSAAVVDGVLQALLSAGAEPEKVTVLVTDSASQAAQLRAQLSELGRDDQKLHVHDPGNDKEMAFLGVSREGLPLRLNRLLCDADFVLPVGLTHCHALANDGEDFALAPFPSFSDRETIQRLANTGAEEFPITSRPNRLEVEDCARQLGAQLRLQVVPHSNGQIAEILAGEASTVLKQSAKAYRKIWETATTVPAKLIIATIAGDEGLQNWQNLGRAIAAAESLLEADGSLVLCSELSEPPGEAICHLAGNEDPLVIEREIQKTQSADCGPAMVLNRVLQRGSVYLRSRLKSAVVESLGITPLESDSELDRLTQLLRPCLVLEEAQYLLPEIVEEEAADE